MFDEKAKGYQTIYKVERRVDEISGNVLIFSLNQGDIVQLDEYLKIITQVSKPFYSGNEVFQNLDVMNGKSKSRNKLNVKCVTT